MEYSKKTSNCKLLLLDGYYSRFILKKGSIEGDIVEVSLANDSYMTNYLGYFFVALSIQKDWISFAVVYIVIFVFTYKSQSLFYNPLFLLFV